MSIHWVMENTHLGGPDYPLWRVEISGQPGVDIAVNLKRPDGDPSKTSSEQWAVAASVVNAIPDVCAAPAGLMAPRMASPFRARFGSGTPPGGFAVLSSAARTARALQASIA
jgi:hypothetical protein